MCSSDEQLDYLITHEGLYKFGFDYCDANLDQECLMKESFRRTTLLEKLQLNHLKYAISTMF